MPIPRKKPPKRIAARKRAKREEEAEGLPFDKFGIPWLREGEGAEIIKTSEPTITITLPFNQAWLVWEAVEAFATRNDRYAGGGPMQEWAIAWDEVRKLFRTRIYESTSGWPFFTRELNRWKKREQERAEEAKKAGRGRKTAATPQKAGETTTAAPPAKKTRCTAEKKGVRCIGPAGHKPADRHKGKLKNGRIVKWKDT